MFRWPTLISLVVIVSLLVLWWTVRLNESPLPPHRPHVSCNLYASATGAPGEPATGTRRRPLRSLVALDRALRPGQTGCLLSGTYGSTGTVHRLANDGSPRGQVTIAAAPGQTPLVRGLIEVEASDTTLEGLRIDGSNDLYRSRRPGTDCRRPVSNGLELDGRHDVFEDNDLYQSVARLRGNGIGVGWNHPADDTIIRDNLIHDIGQCEDYDQMIYLADANGVQIYGNWMWNDPHGWGVQVYPAASDADIYDNVIDHAGSGFVVGGSNRVAGNLITHNIVMNSTGLPRAGLARGVGISTTSGPVGPDNRFQDNVVFGNPGGVGEAPGVVVRGNTTVDPRLVAPSEHDYSLTPRSPSVLAGRRFFRPPPPT